MRTYFILAVLCFSSIIGFGQKLEIEKASPFTAVKWENNEPIVQFGNEWYHFEKLDHINKKELLDYCKKEFGDKWQKRFSEDLVEVLTEGLNYKPNVKVVLQLSKDGVTKEFTGFFTLENRQRSLKYNRNKTVSKTKHLSPKKLTIVEAIEDLRAFEKILDNKSSYAQLSSFDYKSAIKELKTSIENNKGDIDINEFTNEISKIMSEIGDRHSSIKNEAFRKEDHKTYNLRLPFGVAVLNEQIVATKQDANNENYIYYYNSHPNIKSINGIAIETIIDSYNYRDKKAPKDAKVYRSSRAIEKYGALLFKNNIACLDSVKVVFSDGVTDKIEAFKLTSAKKGYNSKLLKVNYSNMLKIENGDFKGLSRKLEDKIGYINIPRMYNYDAIKGFENEIEKALENLLDTKALIIDVRNNPGGGRAIIQTFASYIIKEKQSPWVANVAYLRTVKKEIKAVESMSARYLYSYNSKKFTDNDRRALDEFNSDFKLQKTFDSSKFSKPFYMILHKGNKSYTNPVYILVNENSFSAASVFTSAFKSLRNVKIVGVTTDGSSGNSKTVHLKYSNIRVKVSTMLSFQRNGKTLDGNGTIPDISIPANELQVLKGVDSQLNSLIEMINKGL